MIATPRIARKGAPRRSAARRGFSLVEVLLAVFILGIGVISIAAIFPAGITLQRQSNDDVLGPVVAKNAMALIRARLSQDDFGSFADFNPTVAPYFVQASGGAPILTIEGDWPWMRPGFVFDDPATPGDEGAIDVFSQQFTRKVNNLSPFTSLDVATELPSGWPQVGTQQLWGIPYNPQKYAILPSGSPPGNLPEWRRQFPEPRAFFGQRERYWPMGSDLAGATAERPQYVWDVMFRRFEGRVQVAVFVYRVSMPGGQPRFYSVAPADPSLNSVDCPSAANRSPLPIIFAPPGSSPNWWVAPPPFVVGGPIPDLSIPATGAGSTLNLLQPRFMWQVPGQWILDQNNTIHRVLSGRRNTAEGPVRFARPIPAVPPAAVYGARPGVPGGILDTEGVAQAWYLPIRDANGMVLTPVYVSVEEL